MKSARITLTRLILTSFALSTVVACGGGTDLQEPEEGNSYLTIVGDTNVFVDYGLSRRLSVRYHNSSDQPLAGEIGFAVVGDAKGSTLSRNAGITDSQGIVEIDLRAGTVDAAFAVEASAPFAAPARWSIAISEGNPPLPLVDPEGSHSVSSDFDLTGSLPGTVGDVLDNFIEMTDDPYDPATYLLDKVVENLDNGTLETIVNAARPALDGVVNDYLLQYSPNIVNDLLAIGNKLGQIATHFGTDSELVITKTSGGDPDNANYSAVHTMVGFHFNIDGQNYGYTVEELGAERSSASNVGISMGSASQMSITNHALPIQYGGFLAKALNEVIVPLIDPTAADLYGLLQNQVNCVNVGIEIADFVGFGSASFYEGACELGLEIAAEAIINELIDIDDAAQVTLGVAGTTRAADNNGDRKADTFTNGKWNGTVDYFGSTGTLTQDQSTFVGNRMNVTP